MIHFKSASTSSIQQILIVAIRSRLRSNGNNIGAAIHYPPVWCQIADKIPWIALAHPPVLPCASLRTDSIRRGQSINTNLSGLFRGDNVNPSILDAAVLRSHNRALLALWSLQAVYSGLEACCHGTPRSLTIPVPSVATVSSPVSGNLGFPLASLSINSLHSPVFRKNTFI